LARGKTEEEVKAEGVKEALVHHKVFPGDRPSIQLLFKDEVNPFNLGQLLAIYEHRVAVCGYLYLYN
jgi:glucose-6-phosphate isomerase